MWRAGAAKGVMAAIEHRHTMNSIKFDTLIDVGANRGQFTLLIRSIKPECKVIAFEPLAEATQIFESVHANDDSVTLHQCALGSQKDTAEIYVTAKIDTSSFFRPINSSENGGKKSITEKRMIPIQRLDAILADSHLDGTTLLKIDAQGFEKEVLVGASGIIEKISFVYLEVSLVPLYEGQPLFSEIHNYLSELGFLPVKIGHVGGTPKHIQSQADILYSRNLI
jgi:FkbM family methyltransferase